MFNMSLQMTLQQPDPKMQMLIRKQLNENVSRTQNDLQHIKEWLAKQPHLPQFEGAKYYSRCRAHFLSPHLSSTSPHRCTGVSKLTWSKLETAVISSRTSVSMWLSIYIITFLLAEVTYVGMSDSVSRKGRLVKATIR
jgi:hypothetical protein